MNNIHLKYLILIYIMSAFALSSCFREDPLLPAYQSDPEVKQLTIPLAQEDMNTGQVLFQNQVFLELETGLFQTVARESWDIGFETGPGGYHVMLNSANYMQAANAGLVAFGTIFHPEDMLNYFFDFDNPSGNLDSTIIGEWVDEETGLSKGDLVLIDRGFDGNLEARGYVKLQLLWVRNDTIAFQYGALDAESSQTIKLYIGDSSTNFVYFSFETNQVVNVAPPKQDWDLCFSYYSYRYPDGIPYWLTGVLANRYQVRTAEVQDSAMVFENLSLADTSQFKMTRSIDEIGFDWKEYLFGPPARYVVYSNRIFIVQDTRGIYYKLRFLDFYNEKGQRGFPTLEYAEL
jgi:hypothetical protein